MSGLLQHVRLGWMDACINRSIDQSINQSINQSNKQSKMKQTKNQYIFVKEHNGKSLSRIRCSNPRRTLLEQV